MTAVHCLNETLDGRHTPSETQAVSPDQIIDLSDDPAIDESWHYRLSERDIEVTTRKDDVWLH